MAGGTFTPGVRKIRPGTYINFESVARPDISLSQRGVVVVPLISHSWGPRNEFIQLELAEQNAEFAKLGFRVIDSELLLIREAFKNSIRVITIILATGGATATVTATPLTVTAKYEGTRGNDLNVVITDNVTAGKDVEIFLGTESVYIAEGVVNVADLPASDWVDFTGTGALVNTAGSPLAGGLDGTAVNSDITDFLDSVETQIFNTIVLPSSDATLAAAFDAKIITFRDNIGKYVTGVRPKGVTASNTEGVFNVNNGYILSDGTTLDSTQASAWFGGATAGAAVTESNTYKQVQGAVDVNPRLSHTDTEAAIEAGEVVFSLNAGEVVVETDINSLTNFNPPRDRSYSKGRVIRTLDEVAITAVARLTPNKFDGNNDGYQLAKQEIVALLLLLQDIGAIRNVDQDNDVVIDFNLTRLDEFYADVFVQPVDSIEKYYLTVKTSF